MMELHRGREIQREKAFDPVVRSPDGRNSWGWVRSKSRDWSFIWVSLRGGRVAEAPWPSSSAFPRLLAEIWIGGRTAGTQSSTHSTLQSVALPAMPQCWPLIISLEQNSIGAITGLTICNTLGIQHV